MLPEQLLAGLWQRMADLFPMRWLPAVGEWAPDNTAVRSWGRALAGVAPVELARGLDALVRRGDRWPPAAGEFRALCLESNVPGVEACYLEAVAAARDWPGHTWSHPVAYAAAADVGSWNLRALAERDARRQHADAYTRALRRWQAGEDLRAPVPPKLAPPDRRACDPAVAQRNLDAIAEALRDPQPPHEESPHA